MSRNTSSNQAKHFPFSKTVYTLKKYGLVYSILLIFVFCTCFVKRMEPCDFTLYTVSTGVNNNNNNYA